MLLWASRNAFNLNHVFNDKVPTQEIQEALRRSSEELCQQNRDKELLYLWNGFFSKLLSVDLLSPKALCRLVSTASGKIIGDWPQLVRVLVAICAKQATKLEIDRIREKLLEWQQLPDEPKLTLGLLLSPMLHVDLQKLLLTSPVQIEEEVLKKQLKDVSKNLVDGLASTEEIKIGPPNSRERILKLRQ